MVDLEMGYFDRTKVEPIYLGSPSNEKTILVNEKEYKDLLITKGKYEERVMFCSEILSLLTIDEQREILENMIKK